MSFVGGHSATRLRWCRATPLADTGTLPGTIASLSFCAHLDHPNLRNEKDPPDRSRAGHTLTDQASRIPRLRATFSMNSHSRMQRPQPLAIRRPGRLLPAAMHAICDQLYEAVRHAK